MSVETAERLTTLPVTAVVPTCDRPQALARTLSSLRAQRTLPAELIVVDASSDGSTRAQVRAFAAQVADACAVRWIPADVRGAAAQRNQGVSGASQPVIWFFDDDILFEPDCVVRLWQAMAADASLGGVNAMIVNQRYDEPGRVSRLLFALMEGRNRPTYAGRVIGPAVNLLPEDRDDLPELVPVDWLNTGCTLYRRAAIPEPPFDSVFTGYSMMEDLTLSLRVGRAWKLANVRTARIFHDSQPGVYKSDVSTMAAMELVNRHYVMTEVLGRTRFADYCRLVAWEAFQLGVRGLRADSRPTVWAACRGVLAGIAQIRKREAGPKRQVGGKVMAE